MDIYAAMSRPAFFKTIKSSFGPILDISGFRSDIGRTANYYKKISDDIFHVFTFHRGSNKSKYQVWCFATSPLAQIHFEQRFPNRLTAIMTPFQLDHRAEVGVGTHQCEFFCKNDDAFWRSFERDVRPTLPKAIAFLDRIRTLKDLQNFAVGSIRNDIRRELESREIPRDGNLEL